MISGEIPVNILHQDDLVVVIQDIHPQAAEHLLIIPKKHIHTVNDIQTDDAALMGHLFQTAKQIAIAREISETGYRLVLNCNANAGQSVYHLHMHLLGGQPLANQFGESSC
jgi:histidine triad (HIT) family protein